ncbi:MAG: DUF1573 domain-containing protein [Omnitrophica bacterium]|nr:DUF1573 domain-containing protein [Candidatus Omnitrophota bacterium]
MKKITIAIILSTIVALSPSYGKISLGATSDEQLLQDPKIEVLPYSWSFGKIKNTNIKTHIFKVKNIGQKELIIKRVSTSCGCTKASISSKKIAPGSSAKLKVTFDPKQRKASGKIRSDVYIESNDPENPTKIISIFADLGVKIESKSTKKSRKLVLPPLLISAPKISSFELHSRIQSNEKIVILDVREENEYLLKHIPDAIWLPKSKFDQQDPEVLKKLETIDKKLPMVVYCGAGHRSSYVSKKLIQMGYNAYNLDGISFWEKEGYPLIRGPKLGPTEEPSIIYLEEAYENYYLLFKDVVWVDVRNSGDYKRGHIKGALSIPLSKLESRLGEIPRDQEIVLYCEGTWDGGSCEASRSAGIILIKNGFKQGKIKVFEDGYGAWENAGYPVEFEDKRARIKAELIKNVPGQYPEIVIEPESYDFGKLSLSKGIVETFFIIKNKGKIPLVIDDIKTSCGCTTASLKTRKQKKSPAFDTKGKTDTAWKAKVLPAQQAKLTVTFDPNYHIPDKFPSPVTRMITIYSNDPLEPKKIIRIKAELVE